MMKKKHNEPHDDSYYDALIKQRIGEALRNQSRKERLDLAQLEAWVEADRQKRRAKVKRVLAIASCFVILCVGTFSIKFAFDPEDSIATAGKGDNKVNEQGNSVVVKNNEGDVDENIGERMVTCSTWEAVEEAKDLYPELLIPEYIPIGFKFHEMIVKIDELNAKFTYYYHNETDELRITQIAGCDVTVVNEFDKKLIANGKPLFVSNAEGKRGFYQNNNNRIYIKGDCSDNDFIRIIENL